MTIPSDLKLGLDELDSALEGYEEAERYFEGRVDEHFASAKIRRAVAATGQRYKFRLAATPVKVLANRVKLAGISTAGDSDSDADALIERVRDANDMPVIEPELHLRTFEYGDAYLIVWPYEGDPDDPTDDELAAAGVEITYNSPKCMRVLYDPENQRRKLFAVKRWNDGTEGKPVWRADLYYPDRIERYVSTDHKPCQHLGAWEPFDDDGQPWPLENPYGEIPVFHFRTAQPYGRPEHADAYGPQDAINKLLITQITTVDSHGWPQRYKLTDPGAELDAAGDDPDWDDDTLATRHTGATGALGIPAGAGSGLRSGPGTIQTFTGTKEVGQFEAARPEVFTDPVSLYVRLMSVLTDTPFHYFDPTGDAPSGESLKTANAPLDAKAAHRQLLLTGAWEQVWRFVQRVAGRTPVPVEVAWAPPDVVTDKDFWETARLKLAAGVPLRQVLLEANYTPAQLDAWGITEETRPPAPPAPPDDRPAGGSDDDEG